MTAVTIECSAGEYTFNSVCVIDLDSSDNIVIQGRNLLKSPINGFGNAENEFTATGNDLTNFDADEIAAKAKLKTIYPTVFNFSNSGAFSIRKGKFLALQNLLILGNNNYSAQYIGCQTNGGCLNIRSSAALHGFWRGIHSDANTSRMYVHGLTVSCCSGGIEGINGANYYGNVIIFRSRSFGMRLEIRASYSGTAKIRHVNGSGVTIIASDYAEHGLGIIADTTESGAMIYRNSTFRLYNTKIFNTALRGIHGLYGSMLEINNSEIFDIGLHGITVEYGCTLLFSGNTPRSKIYNCQGSGISSTASTVFLNAEFSNNCLNNNSTVANVSIGNRSTAICSTECVFNTPIMENGKDFLCNSGSYLETNGNASQPGRRNVPAVGVYGSKGEIIF